MPPESRTLREHVALWSLYGAVVAFMLQLGGSLYEHLVLDTAWLQNPALIQPSRGGVDRKLFWIPVHAISTLFVLIGLWAAWPNRDVRRYVLWALGLYFAMRLWTAAYFVPLALSFEAPRDLSPDMLQEARRWVLLSVFRFPLVLAATVLLWLGARREESRPRVARMKDIGSAQGMPRGAPRPSGG